MTLPHTRAQLAHDLRAVGVEPGDLLFMHSSFTSLGPVEGGAGAMIGALEDAVGPDGLLLLPSFNLVEGERRAETWDVATTPSTVGWLTEFFRLMPGTARSDHYSHSVAARGRGAREFVSDHLSQEGDESPWDRAPWGRTFGTNSPMRRACERGGKLLMLGVDYDSSTYCHVVEVIYWNRLRAHNPRAPYLTIDRRVAGAYWDRVGRPRRGRVGDAACRLFSIRDYVTALLAAVDKDPETYRSWNGGR